MKTKKEILNAINFGYVINNSGGYEEVKKKAALEAMDEYAKEQVVAYEIWLDAELNNDSSFNYGKTPEQLYSLFMEHQSLNNGKE